MKSQDIRRTFLDFFVQHQHTEVASSPLIPGDDPSLLFTNAGMVQFKDVFLGKELRSYRRATTVQKCLRAGGKHNDLDNVGYTARHHTFFEMLGNFSFGDYFKEQAITLAWTLLTRHFCLPVDRLWITVYDQDQESAQIWSRFVHKERIIRIGDNKGAPFASDNFWQMADTGPCGPCTEIFFDHGPSVCGGLPGTPEEDGDRYMEIWNIVFMQYFRNESGVFEPLPKPCVDTGMGLERIAAVLQSRLSNYDTDIFHALIEEAAHQLHIEDLELPSLKVIADHIRACTFMIADGIMPSNEGRGYVLRRIIRRALRHAHQLNSSVTMLPSLVPVVVDQMGMTYSELPARMTAIMQVLAAEEDKFSRTIEHGMRLLGQSLLDSPTCLPGHVVFKLYDTFGFPVDLTADICRERGIEIDLVGFDACMAEQKKRAREAQAFHHRHGADIPVSQEKTRFLGYEEYACPIVVVGLLDDQKSPISLLNPGQQGYVICDQTVFYGESGGQVGDVGTIDLSDGRRLRVDDTQKADGVFLHHVTVEMGSVSLGDLGMARIDVARRQAISRHHSATHLIHKALKHVLGPHVEQKGSHVNEQRLRFDFAHHETLTVEVIREVETLVNEEVLANTLVATQHLPYEEAIRLGACFLKTEKYTEHVRVLTIGSSCELCGGAHVLRTGDIGCVKIIENSAVGSGIRRIEAVAGLATMTYLYGMENNYREMANHCAVSPKQLPERVIGFIEHLRTLKKEIQSLRRDKMQALVQAQKKHCISIPDADGRPVSSWFVVHAFDHADELDLFIDLAQSACLEGILCIFARLDNKTIVRVLSTASGISAMLVFHAMQKFIPDLKGGGTPQRVKGQTCMWASLSEQLTEVQAQLIDGRIYNA